MKAIRAFAVLLALSVLSSAAVADLFIESPLGNVVTRENVDPCNGANLDWASLKGVCDISSPTANRKLCCFNVDLLLSQIFESESFNAKCALNFAKLFEKNGYAHLAWNYEQICGRSERRGLAEMSSPSFEAPTGGQPLTPLGGASTSTSTRTTGGAKSSIAAPSSTPASSAMSIGAPMLMQFAIAFLAILLLR